MNQTINMEISWTWALVAAAIALLTYYFLNAYIFSTWNYFTDRGIVFERGWPLLGVVGSALLLRQSGTDLQQWLYKRYEKYRFAGLFQVGGTPTYLIIDPELIKAITIKDFDHFVNHGLQIRPDIDPLMGRSLINMSDERWREMRSVLSPLFTGSKMRGMLSLMCEANDAFVAAVRTDVLVAGASGLEYNMLDLLTCSTADVIATCAFGIKINSYLDRTNEFYASGNRIVADFQSFRLLLPMMMPNLCKWLGLTVGAKRDYNFFRNIVRQTVDERKRLGIVRNDMIHLLMLLDEGRLDSIEEKEADQDVGFATVQESLAAKAAVKLKTFTDDDLMAQSMVFFVAGFSAVADNLCLIAQELAMHPDIQERLYNEVIAVAETLGDAKQIAYEQLQRMKYLDMVVTETMRLYAFSFIIERKVSKQYVMENNDGTKVVLQPGELVWIPAFAIQRDPKYYPEPNKFDPERFAPENKGNIDPATYLPFGIGPRMCIGNRFALMQLKVTIFYLLLNFRLECSRKTCVPMRIAPKIATLEPVGGFWLQLKLRKETNN